MRVSHSPAALCVFFTVAGMAACRSGDGNRAVTAALQRILAAKPIVPVDASVWTNVRAFYKQRQSAPAWVENNETSKRVRDALHVLNAAPAHGFAAADYGEPQIVRQRDALKDSDSKKDDGPDRARQLAEFDVRVTTALLALGRDVAIGRTKPQAVARLWKMRRDAPDLVVALGRAIDGDLNLKTWLDAIRPPHPDYAALQKAFADLNGLRAKGGWPRVPPGTFKPGTSHPSVAILRQRLAASVQLRGAAATSASAVYDKDIEAAVRAFQSLHALKETGVADVPTLAAMNVPLDARIRQVELEPGTLALDA